MSYKDIKDTEINIRDLVRGSNKDNKDLINSKNALIIVPSENSANYVCKC